MTEGTEEMTTAADAPAKIAEPTHDLTCPCGNALRRDGVVVKSHWTGSICEDCESDIWRKHPANRSAKMAEAAALLDKEADLMAAWLREMADDARMTDEDSSSLMAAVSLIQKLRSRHAEASR